MKKREYEMIENPNGTKEELWLQANSLVSEFLKLNSTIRVPKIIVDNSLPGYGVANHKTIKVNLKKCRPATQNPGFAWSYPGYKADLTPVGVLCHEVGHVSHFSIDLDYQNYVTKIVRVEKPVSSYEPNFMEVIAESMKLFISNPNMLKVGRPKRYKMLTEFMGLQPVHDNAWREVLSAAHPKFIIAAEKWCKN